MIDIIIYITIIITAIEIIYSKTIKSYTLTEKADYYKAKLDALGYTFIGWFFTALISIGFLVENVEGNQIIPAIGELGFIKIQMLVILTILVGASLIYGFVELNVRIAMKRNPMKPKKITKRKKNKGKKK